MVIVLSEKIFSPQNFLYATTGKIYPLTGINNSSTPECPNPIIDEIHKILRENEMEDDHLETLWDWCLSEIDEIVEGQHQVVLVDVSHFKNGNWTSEYRWFQVPDCVKHPEEFELDDGEVD